MTFCHQSLVVYLDPYEYDDPTVTSLFFMHTHTHISILHIYTHNTYIYMCVKIYMCVCKIIHIDR